MSEPRRAEVWWGEAARVGRRPYLVLTRNPAIDHLRTVLVAPITRTVRGIPTEARLGPDDGMPTECAATFDNVAPFPKSFLVERICASTPARMVEACEALRVAVDC